MAKLTFQDSNTSYHTRLGTELTRLPQLYPSIPLKFGCRQGECGVCVIRVLEGEKHLSPQTKQEKATLQRLGLQAPHRLACQCALNGDVLIN